MKSISQSVNLLIVSYEVSNINYFLSSQFLQSSASPSHQSCSAHARLRLSNPTGIMTMEC